MIFKKKQNWFTRHIVPPIKIEAWEYDGWLDFSKTLPEEIKQELTKIRLTGMSDELRVENSIGTHYAYKGDYIIKNGNHDYIVMDSTTFNKTYYQGNEGNIIWA